MRLTDVDALIDDVLDFVYANRPQEYSIEFQASINELPRYEIYVEGVPPLLVEPKEATDGN